MAFIESERRIFLRSLCATVLGTKPGRTRTPTMADVDSATSVQISTELLAELGRRGCSPSAGIGLAGGEIGAEFDRKVHAYLDRAFVKGMKTLRPGDFYVSSGVHIRDTAQYAHLEILRQIGEDPTVTVKAVARDQFRAVIAGDYQVQADVVILRRPERAPTTPRGAPLLNPSSGAAAATPLLVRRRAQNDILHANISCKWTFRSDRAQNIRTEAVALMRHRKGPMPHMVVVTAEPLPSRLRSIAIGTGEVDCVYHVALGELESALHASRSAAASFASSRARGARERALTEQIAMFELMRNGDRLRDISDLPFDLSL
jgi:NgoMIV restriction enzyme